MYALIYCLIGTVQNRDETSIYQHYFGKVTTAPGNEFHTGIILLKEREWKGNGWWVMIRSEAFVCPSGTIW